MLDTDAMLDVEKAYRDSEPPRGGCPLTPPDIRVRITAVPKLMLVASRRDCRPARRARAAGSTPAKGPV